MMTHPNLVASMMNPAFYPHHPGEVTLVQTHIKEMIRQNYTAVVRKSKGREILAACGQLSGATC